MELIDQEASTLYKNKLLQFIDQIQKKRKNKNEVTKSENPEKLQPANQPAAFEKFSSQNTEKPKRESQVKIDQLFKESQI